MGPAAPLQLALRPSVSLTAFLFCGHALALGVVLMLALDGALRWGLAAALLASCGWQLRRIWRPAVLSLRAGPEALLQLEKADGTWFEGKVLAQTTVLSWLIVLLLRVEGRRRALTLVLPLDALRTESHRLLRRWLLWASQAVAVRAESADPEA